MNPTTKDGKIAYLSSIFPQLDKETIRAVTYATGEDVDKALNILLEMGDSKAPIATQQPSSPTTVSPSQQSKQLELLRKEVVSLTADIHKERLKYNEEKQSLLETFKSEKKVLEMENNKLLEELVQQKQQISTELNHAQSAQEELTRQLYKFKEEHSAEIKQIMCNYKDDIAQAKKDTFVVCLQAIGSTLVAASNTPETCTSVLEEKIQQIFADKQSHQEKQQLEGTTDEKGEQMNPEEERKGHVAWEEKKFQSLVFLD